MKYKQEDFTRENYLPEVALSQAALALTSEIEAQRAALGTVPELPVCTGAIDFIEEMSVNFTVVGGTSFEVSTVQPEHFI